MSNPLPQPLSGVQRAVNSVSKPPQDAGPALPSGVHSPGDTPAAFGQHAEETSRLRRELEEKNRLIALMTRQLNSPVYLLRAAVGSLGRLVPYAVRRLREKRAKSTGLRNQGTNGIGQHQIDRLLWSREIETIHNSSMFDDEWYRSRHPEIAQSGVDPVVHYLTTGAALGYDPCRTFSTKGYLANNPDVAEAGINPLFHYIAYGRLEGRHCETNDYAFWIERFDEITDADRTSFRKAVERLPRRPLISVLMPVYNTEQEWLVKAIDSVRAQLYPDWELCISDDASTKPYIRDILDDYARKDPRIRVVYRDRNGHISANTNSALALARGEFVALMDDDDELPEHALFWIANEIVRHPDVDLIYSDEDKMDVTGRRYDPYFKPDWNPALILSQNFFSHLGVYRRNLVEKVGGFRPGFEGSQDHDLALRCADESSPDRIRHTPRVLYHWRARPGSTASAEAIKAKPYAWQAAAKAIEEHLQRRGIDGKVDVAFGQYYQVHYPVPASLPKVSIIMPSACKLHLLKPCIEALFSRTTYPDFELLLVVSDIRFKDREQATYLDSLKRNSRIRILKYEDRPFNFSWLNNWAASQATGSVFCFMNDDIEVLTVDWLQQLVTRVKLERVAAAGPMLYYPDDTIQHAGVTLGLWGVAGHSFLRLPKGSAGYFARGALEQDLSCLTAACMVMRREAFEEAKGFNEEFAVAFNDVDLCIRIRRAGWRLIWTPRVEMYHHESASLGQHNSEERKIEFEREVALMREMWGPVLDSDPYYNPNLSLASNNFTLAFPPRISKMPEEGHSQ
jgi:GT2 family glycosyltransferase